MTDHIFQFVPHIIIEDGNLKPRGETPILLSVEIKRLIPTVMRLVRLYQVAFPDRQPLIQINNRESIIKALIDFLNLVDIHHFPLNPIWQWHEEEDNYYVNQDGYPIHPWLFEIPVKVVGYASHDIEPETYGKAVAFITRLGWVGGIKEIALSHKEKLFGNHPWDFGNLDSFRLTPLIPILEKMDLAAPLDGLPALIKMVQHDTDTFFLDACSLCESFSGKEFEWTSDNFHWFCQDWQKAKPIYQKAEGLNQWADTPERLHLIWTTLRQAHSRLPKR